jgi:hypothetical protein
MCDFIVLGVPTKQTELVKGPLPPPLQAWPCGNATLRQVIPATHAIFWVVASQCSCGVWPAETTPAPAHDPKSRRGWSSGKKARAARDAALAKATQPSSHRSEVFVAWVQELLAASDGPVFLHVAIYRGNQESEVPPLLPEQRINVLATLPPLAREALLRLSRPGRAL